MEREKRREEDEECAMGGQYERYPRTGAERSKEGERQRKREAGHARARTVIEMEG